MSPSLHPTPTLKTFLNQSFILGVGQVAGILISVAAGIFITRALGPEGRGVYTWLLTLSGIGAYIAMFGLDTANRRMAAQSPHHIPALVRLNGMLVGIGGVGVALVLAFLAYRQPAAGHNLSWLAMALLTVPLNAFTAAIHPVLVAQNRIYTASLLTFLPKVVLAAAFCMLLAGNWVSEGNALLANLIAATLGTGLALWYIGGILRQPAHLHPLHYFKSIWGTYAGIYVAGVSYYLMQKVDVLIIGLLMDSASTGYYGVASNMVDIMIMPVSLIASLLATRLAAGQAGGLSRQVVAFSMVLAVAGSTFTFFIAPWLIPFMFGAEFTPSAVLLQWLCPAVVALAFFMLMQNALTSLGRARHMAIPPLLGAASNIALNFMLIPTHGLVGACWASIIAYTLAGISAAALVRSTVQKR